MRAGDLHHQMDVVAPVGVLSDVETAIDSTVPMAVDALELPFQAREQLGLGGVQYQTFYTVRCRYREDLRTSYVLRERCHLRQEYQILALIAKPKIGELHMTCVANG